VAQITNSTTVTWSEIAGFLQANAAIGTAVQGWSAALDAISALSYPPVVNTLIIGTGAAYAASALLPSSAMPAITGDVSVTAGTTSASIAANAVSNAKLAQAPGGSIKGNASGSVANVQDLTVLPTAVMPALTGDVTNTAGSLSTTIAANAVTNAKAAQMAAGTIKGNATGSSANAQDLTVLPTACMPALTGDVTNTAGSLATSLSQNVNQAVTASGASLAINYATGPDVSLTLSATVTSFTVSNWPASGKLGRLLLEIASTGAFNITGWPGTTIWSAGTAPTITSGNGKKDTILLTSNDGGTNFRGYVIAQAMA
jgi:hypothetical protein